MPPRIKIPVHVFGYGLALCPAVIYGIYYRRNHPSDEELEDELRKNYADKIKNTREKRADMEKFLQAMKNPQNDPELQRKMDEALKGGKGQAKRHYHVDEELYGTEEGMKKRQEAEEEMRRKKEQQEERRKRKKKNRADHVSDDKVKTNDGEKAEGKENLNAGKATAQRNTTKDKGSAVDLDANEKSVAEKVASEGGSGVDTKSVVTIAAVGTAAAAIGFFLGGRRSQ